MVLEVVPVSSPAAPATVLERIVGNRATGSVERELRLLFLGCEAQPPYGPYEHTAALFLDLITRALQEIDATNYDYYKIVMDVYHVSEHQFPPRSVYGDYNGIILPGSFSAAYDTDPWILELCNVIQEELVPNQRPTLGVCFGHQILAHSFPQGGAIKCPAGPQAGRKAAQLTSHGKQWLFDGSTKAPSSLESDTVDRNEERDALHLFYSHGDMVEKLPPQGRVLGGTKEVPIQTAIYLTEHNKPFAITFQAHPEYASSQSVGLEGTLNPILQAMHERRDISSEEWKRAKADAKKEYTMVEQQSIQTMITAGRLLGWFPGASK